MTPRKPGGFVTAVRPGSLAARIGLKPGDRLLAVNDSPVRDVIDVQFHASEDTVRMCWKRGTRIREGSARRTVRSRLGLEFAFPTFDTDIRRCNNRCPFCFVVQMPRGMRRTLYVKDDDYRYSFLFGHFVTLTNLAVRDWSRIAEQRLSPLYVSVHATEPDLRVRLLGNPAAGNVLERLRFLADHGIEIHTQVVLIPGVNDGPHLERTLRDLAGLHPAVRSCAVVPVGVTRFQRRGIRPYGSSEMEEILSAVESFQVESLRRIGTRFAFPTDEWYLATGRDIPSSDAYEDIDLRENGLGMARDFLEDAKALFVRLNRRSRNLHSAAATLVTGTLFEGTLRRTAAELAESTGAALDVVAVPNRLFGETVTVAGLLTVGDVLAALRDRPGERPVILPRVMFAHPGALALDDRSPLDIARELGREVWLADTMSGVADSLAGRNSLRVGPRGRKITPAFLRAGGW